MEDLNKINYFAKTNTRGKETPFGIKRKDRARHMYVIGKTGMGKSTLLENMAIQDIRNGEGIAFIDPHGSTADRILEYVPPHRVNDVLYFAPFDMDFPVAFNVMEDVGYDKRHLVVSGLLSAFRKIWVDAWSARMEYILSNTLLALLEYPDSTLLDVNRMLIIKSFRDKVVNYIQDPIVKSFWVDEYAKYTDRYTQEATPAIQNKIGQFTSNPLIRNIVGQPKSSFDLRRMMDEKKIVIMNLSKGRVGEVNATLLGSMLVTKLYLSAMSRADVPATVLDALPSFYFYVDEFQNFANQSFADILSEARKYKLNLIIAHQYIEQMEEEVRNAVFGNVGTTVTFRVGPFDAETLETIFLPQFTKEDLVNLGAFQIYVTLMIDGVGSSPFSAQSLSPFDPSPQNLSEQAKESSRAQFGKLRAAVEASIAERQTPEPAAPKPPATRRSESEGGGAAAVRETTRSPSTQSGNSFRSAAGAPSIRNVDRTERAPAIAQSEINQPSESKQNREHRAEPNVRSERPRNNNRPNRREEEHKKIEAPPGAHSLREAIAKVTGENMKSHREGHPRGGSEKSPTENGHDAARMPLAAGNTTQKPDLKAVLAAIIPPSAPKSQNVPQQSSPPPATPLAQNSQKEKSPDGISNHELQKMLKVDGME